MKNKKTLTIGDIVDKRVKDAIKLYNALKDDKDKEINEKAKQLARHDTVMENIIARMTLEKLDHYLEQLENNKRDD